MEDSPEKYFDTSHTRIKNAFKEYEESLKPKRNPDDDDCYEEWSSFGAVSNSLLLNSVSDVAGAFHELLDTDSYPLNILGEPFFMLDYLVQQKAIPANSELYGLASFLKFDKSFTKRRGYAIKVSNQEFFYKHLQRWRSKLKIVDSKLLRSECNEIIVRSGFDNHESFKDKSVFEKLTHTNDGISKIYDLLSNPEYVFLTQDYLDIFKSILPQGFLTKDYDAIVYSCFTKPGDVLKKIKESAVYDFTPVVEMLKRSKRELTFDFRRFYTYGDPGDSHYFQNALRKNILKNAILAADLYASSKLFYFNQRALKEERYQSYVAHENYLKWSVKDWEDTMNDYGIHEDGL